MFRTKWTREFLYAKLKSEYEATLASIDPDQDITDELIERELSTKFVHSRMINAYSRAGLNFFGFRDLKFERNEFCHSVSKLPIQQEQIQFDLLNQCPIGQDDSQEIRNLRLSLQQLLEVNIEIK